MKLRQLFDTLTGGQLDSKVEVEYWLNLKTSDALCNRGIVKGVRFRDDGTPVIIVHDIP